MDGSAWHTTVERLTRDLVRIPSVNPPGREAPAAALVVEELTAAGLTCHQVPVTGDRHDIVALLPGEDRSSGTIFTGHLDVVPVPDAQRWSVDPFAGVTRQGRLFGRGAADMKGGLAALVVALTTVARSGQRPPRDVVLVATCDEEDFMSGAKALTGSELLAPYRDVVVAEPTGLTLCSAGWGRTYGTVTVRGTTGHGSQGAGAPTAIDLARQVMDGMDTVDLGGGSFWRTLAIHAGADPYVVPDVCTLTVDARLTPGTATSTVWQAMDQVVATAGRAAPGLDIDVTVTDRREPWAAPDDCPLVARTAGALSDLGLPTTRHTFPGTTDGSVLRQADRRVVIVGPGRLEQAHAVDEFVEIDQLVAACELYHRLMTAPG